MVLGHRLVGRLFKRFSVEKHRIGIDELCSGLFAQIDLKRCPTSGFVAIFFGELLGRQSVGIG